jgi:hypothetical protein
MKDEGREWKTEDGGQSSGMEDGRKDDSRAERWLNWPCFWYRFGG